MAGLFDCPKLQTYIDRLAPRKPRENLPRVREDRLADIAARERLNLTENPDNKRRVAVLPHGQLYLAIKHGYNRKQHGSFRNFIHHLVSDKSATYGHYHGSARLVPRQCKPLPV